MPTYITSHYRSISLTDNYDSDQLLVLTTADIWSKLVTNLKSRLTPTELAEIFADISGHFVYISDSADTPHPAG